MAAVSPRSFLFVALINYPARRWVSGCRDVYLDYILLFLPHSEHKVANSKPFFFYLIQAQDSNLLLCTCVCVCMWERQADREHLYMHMDMMHVLMCTEVRGWNWVSSSIALCLLFSSSGLLLRLQFTESSRQVGHELQKFSCLCLLNAGIMGFMLPCPVLMWVLGLCPEVFTLAWKHFTH